MLAESKADSTNKIAAYATALSTVEVGLGSLLHSFQVPLAGQLLSLNQGFVLTRASLDISSRSAGAYVSTISSILKSLSPAGKKLTPMLAIAMQGLLFSTGTLIFGVNVVGLLTGMTLLCLWAFLQPVLLYLAIYGDTLIDVANYYTKMLSEILTVPRESLFIAVSVVVGVKVIAGVCLVIVAMRINPKKVDLYFTKMKGIRSSKVARKNSRSPIRGALEDLMSPLFLMTLILTLVFMLVTKQETSALIWGLLRPLAIGFLLFYLIRVLPLEMLLERLSRTRFKTFSKVALESVAALKRIEIK
jgi:hypothetical protein